MNERKNDVIDTGLVEFVLPFDRGAEKIYFNPNDVDFFIRITDMITNIGKKYDDLENRIEKAENDLDKMQIIRRLNEEIKTEFDIAFGNDVSDVIFKYVSPHGIVNKNTYYSFYILEYLMPLIEKETGQTAKKATEWLSKLKNKHTIKYQNKLR